MIRFLKDPLLHFILIGAGLFFVYNKINPGQTDHPDKIVVSQGKIETLITTFSRTWQRPPTQEELDGLITDYLREEVATREALALGLDRDDVVIRRRLRQKLEFISTDLAAQKEPTESELRSYFDEFRDQFRSDEKVAFRQIFLSSEKRGDDLKIDSVGVLAQLEQLGKEADPGVLGDFFLLGHDFPLTATSEIVKQFGRNFAEKISKLPLQKWSGPVESGYGVHFVWLEQFVDAHEMAFEDVVNKVRQMWIDRHREEFQREFYESLLKRYSITIEPPVQDFKDEKSN